MIIAVKFVFIVFSAGLFYLIARFAEEYFHPYKRRE